MARLDYVERNQFEEVILQVFHGKNVVIDGHGGGIWKPKDSLSHLVL